MDINSVERTVNLLVGALHMRMDFHDMAQINTGTKKLLIVEGQTDERFIRSHLCEDVICMVANKAFGTGNSFSPQPILNCKKAIIEVVYGLSVYPTIIKCPKGSENWNVFGMIDMDFDDINSHTRNTKLFITDTHDLETLMLSTEPDLLQKIKCCIISAEDAKKALFMAYQLGKTRQLLVDVISTKALSVGNEDVGYSDFILEDYRISLKGLISYLNEKAENTLSSAKEKKLYSQLTKNKSFKKFFSNDGIWRSGIESFDASSTHDLWDVVNGHDILSLIRYINEAAAIKFKSTSAYSLNREFELSLIDAYDAKNFKTTKIYTRMLEENIVHA